MKFTAFHKLTTMLTESPCSSLLSAVKYHVCCMGSIYKSTNNNGTVTYYGSVYLNGKRIRKRLANSRPAALKALKKFEYEILFNEESQHQMIKTDALRYLSHGAEIKRDLNLGKNFFETGRDHFTKYLPPRIAAAYYYFFDVNLFNNFEEKKINLGVHFYYLIIQCFFFYASLFFL